jgi:hypothetical protein
MESSAQQNEINDTSGVSLNVLKPSDEDMKSSAQQNEIEDTSEISLNVLNASEDVNASKDVQVKSLVSTDLKTLLGDNKEVINYSLTTYSVAITALCGYEEEAVTEASEARAETLANDPPQNNIGLFCGFLSGLLLIPIGLAVIAGPVFVVCGTQFIILIYIWYSLPGLGDSAMCHSPIILELCVVGIFLAYSLKNITDLQCEWAIIHSKEAYINPNKGRGITVAAGAKFDIMYYLALIILLGEVLVLIMSMVVGIAFILTTEGPGNIVQAAVAITFVNELDNVLGELIYSGSITGTTKTDFIVTKSNEEDDDTKFWGQLSFLLFLPSLVCVCVGIVIGLRNDNCY